MQLTFSFDKNYPSSYLETKEFFNALFKKICTKDLIGDWVRAEFRSGGLFIYRMDEPQLEFPHSRYWGFEDCEP